MDKEKFHILILFFAVVIAQAFICNHILLFGIAVPLVMVYFIARMPIGMNKGLLFSLSFLMGLLVDICSDTPGLNALAATLTAGLRQPIFYAYVQHDDRVKNIIPSILSLGMATYCKYLFSLTTIFSLLVFSIEYFSFADVKEILILSAGSSVLTFVLLLGLDSVLTIRHDKR